MRKRDIFELAAILAVWFTAILLIKPVGNFPLGDDWDFAIATWNFARTGHFHFTAFTAVSLRAMVLWGAAWTRLFGESFEVLRASTLTLAAITIGVIHEILRHAKCEQLVVRQPVLLLDFRHWFSPPRKRKGGLNQWR